MILLRILLIPVSLIYCLIVGLRNKFYDSGIFRSFKVSKPVISIGNITTGGTGKTPLTIFISEYYLEKGLKVGIISRGYKRKSKDLITVSDGLTINENIEESGDELVLIANELIKDHRNNFSIAAGKDRVKAAEYLIGEFGPDIIILDDGFQHRRLKRDLDIVLIDSNNLLNEKFLNTFTLPSGMLRESMVNLKRADLIVQNNKNEKIEVISALKNYDREMISMRYKTEYFIDNKNSILTQTGVKAILFSGIADDESFIKMVKEKNIIIEEVIKFSDHHNYTEPEIRTLMNSYDKDNIFITTSKDFVKIKKFKDFTENYPIFFLKMGVEFDKDRDKLFSILDKTVL